MNLIQHQTLSLGCRCVRGVTLPCRFGLRCSLNALSLVSRRYSCIQCTWDGEASEGTACGARFVQTSMQFQQILKCIAEHMFSIHVTYVSGCCIDCNIFFTATPLPHSSTYISNLQSKHIIVWVRLFVDKHETKNPPTASHIFRTYIYIWVTHHHSHAFSVLLYCARWWRVLFQTTHDTTCVCCTCSLRRLATPSRVSYAM